MTTLPRTAHALFFHRAADRGEALALRQFDGVDAGHRLTWREWADLSHAFGAALVGAEHQPGEIAAVFAGNRLLWPVAEMGILEAGLVSAGIYPTSAAPQVRQLLADSRATAVIVDTAERLAKVLASRDTLPSLRTIIVQDAPAEGLGVHDWSAWLRRGVELLADERIATELARRSAAVREEDTAALIYTSGSTGEPKGARISHRYLLASAASIRDTLKLTSSDSTLSYLPFCHAAERVFGLYTRVLCGMPAVLIEDYRHLWDAARTAAPTLFGGLPHFFEKVYAALQEDRAAARGSEAERWARVLELGRQRSSLRQRGAVVPIEVDDEWRRLGAPLFDRVQEHLGGAVRLATSGGAPLPTEVAEFLDALGVTVLGAYGMTEHLCVAFHRPESYAFEGVGTSMPGTELRLAADGEVMVRRSALTFSGYHGREADTAAAFSDDGEWLLTGDLGALDERGNLRITGRKKELIALSTGKKVAPLPIEARLAEDPAIAQAMLYGNGRRFISALIAPRQFAADGNGASRDELVRRIQAAVERVNASLSRTEQIKRWVLLDRELSADADELTPNLKIRRGVVAERFRDQLAALYE